MVATKLMTVEELETMGEDAGTSLELFDGLPREHPGVRTQHGYLGFDLGFQIAAWAKPRGLGIFFTSDTQFVLSRDPDTVVKPDIAFIRTERMPPPEENDRISRVPPDFAVEIVSPTDRRADIEDKIRRYQAAEVPLLWYADPARRTVTVSALGAEPVVFREGDTLDGGEVFPGFTLAVAAIFA
jgi:Uma2 family endonuclease